MGRKRHKCNLIVSVSNTDLKNKHSRNSLLISREINKDILDKFSKQNLPKTPFICIFGKWTKITLEEAKQHSTLKIEYR